MKLLVTGADGFVGRHLVREALQQGWTVTAVLGPGGSPPAEWLPASDAAAVQAFTVDLTENADLAKIAVVRADAIVHLAAVASGTAAREDPEGAMRVNALATTWLLAALGEVGHPARLLYVSSGEVYGPAHSGPIAEGTPLNPVSAYAASKAAAEPAVLDLGPDNGLEVIVARPFPHTGPGQSTSYVLPALASRLSDAKRTGATAVKTGNLDPVRDFLDVRDVVRAYLLLLEDGVPGEVYNVASGVGHRLADCFRMLADIIGVDATAAQDAALLRPGDIPVLIGNPAKLQNTTGWSPRIPFERTLQDLIDAQAH